MKKKQTKKTISKKSDLEQSSLKTSQTSKNDSATMIVKIISVFEFIGAGFAILFGLLLLFGSQFFLAMLPLAEISQVPAALIGAAVTLMSILMIIYGIIAIFLARGLWNYKNWARIVFIVFSSLGILAALFSLPSGILGLLLHGLIVYFLGFNKDVVALFK